MREELNRIHMPGSRPRGRLKARAHHIPMLTTHRIITGTGTRTNMSTITAIRILT